MNVQDHRDSEFKQALSSAFMNAFEKHDNSSTGSTVTKLEEPIVDWNKRQEESKGTLSTEVESTSTLPTSVSSPCITCGWVCGGGKTAILKLNKINEMLNSCSIPTNTQNNMANVHREWVPKIEDVRQLKLSDKLFEEKKVNIIHESWKNAEVKKLVSSYMENGPNYEKIAKEVGTKSISRVRYKIKALFPECVRSPHSWTEEEDKLLLQLREQCVKWVEIQKNHFPSVKIQAINTRWRNLTGISSYRKCSMPDKDIYRVILMKEMKCSDQEICGHFPGRDMENITRILAKRNKVYLYEYRNNYLEWLNDVEKTPMKYPFDIKISKSTLKNPSKALNEEYLQFLPLLRQELDKMYSFNIK